MQEEERPRDQISLSTKEGGHSLAERRKILRIGSMHAACVCRPIARKILVRNSTRDHFSDSVCRFDLQEPVFPSVVASSSFFCASENEARERGEGKETNNEFVGKSRKRRIFLGLLVADDELSSFLSFRFPGLT